MKKYLLLLGIMLIFPITANAANASIELSSNTTTIGKGDNITVNANVTSKDAIGYYEYTLDYDHSKLKLISGDSYNVDRANDSETKKFKKTFKFKALSSGNTKISVKSYAVTSYQKEDNLSVTIKSLNIKINNNKSTTNNSNYLSSLEVEGYELLPNFTKDNTDYTLNIEKDINNINIKATAENKNATIKGTGKRSISDGENKLEIVVTNQKGDSLTYSILVTLKDPKPIKVKYNEKEYTVIKNIDDIDLPDGYKQTEIKINNQTIKAAYNEITKITLVALKDENDNISLFIYENDNYSPYNEININKFSFLPIKTDEKLKGYEKYNETINDIDVECYKAKSDSDYCLIYGMNLNTGEKGWYSYDKKEGTIQKYNKELEKIYKDKNNNTKVLIYILSGTTLIFGIATIVLAIKKSKRNTNIVK